MTINNNNSRLLQHQRSSSPAVEISTLSLQKNILSVVLQIREQNNQILILLKDNKNIREINSSLRNLPENIPIDFPIDCDESVFMIENHLANKDNLTALSLYLSSLGGKTLKTSTNTVLKYLLTDKLSSKYSFYGKRLNKKAFSQLLLKKAVISAVKLHLPNATEKEIEDAIKKWLKHAPS